MVEVTVVKARNLTRQDFFGLSDPYAVIQLDEIDDTQPASHRLADWTASPKIQHKTKLCKNTLDPVWSAKFSFVMRTDRKYAIYCHVWDWDRIKSDDELGDVTVPLSPEMFDDEERWFKLENVPAPAFLTKARTEAGRSPS